MTYKHPPITEAIIDLRVTLPADVTIAHIERAYKNIAQGYPIAQERREFSGRFEMRDGKAVSNAADHGVKGFLYWNDPKTQAVQYRLDGFTFSRLAPYSNWAEASQETKRLWGFYVDCVLPLYVNRLAVRYINRVEIPAPKVELKDYFDIPFGIPKGLGKVPMEHLVYQVTMRFSETERATLNFTPTPASRPGSAAFILDIDVYSDVTLDARLTDDIWVTLEKLRSIRTDIFENSITNQTRALFQ